MNRHVYEKVSLKFDGVYNRLWTVTGAVAIAASRGLGDAI